jgi:hypothetical protein
LIVYHLSAHTEDISLSRDEGVDMKKSDFKQQIRSQAKRVVGGSNATASGHKNYCDAVERGRKQLLVASNEGGDSPGKKFRSEIMYLLNNYLPQYDTRIEALIDAWRTSHDPSYDPGIRVQLRQARLNYMKKSNPF